MGRVKSAEQRRIEFGSHLSKRIEVVEKKRHIGRLVPIAGSPSILSGVFRYQWGTAWSVMKREEREREVLRAQAETLCKENGIECSDITDVMAFWAKNSLPMPEVKP